MLCSTREVHADKTLHEHPKVDACAVCAYVHLPCHAGNRVCNHPAYTGSGQVQLGFAAPSSSVPGAVGTCSELKARILEHQLHHIKVAHQHDLGACKHVCAGPEHCIKNPTEVQQQRVAQGRRLHVPLPPLACLLRLQVLLPLAQHLNEHGEVLLCAVTQLGGASSRVNECLCLEGAECPVKLGFMVLSHNVVDWTARSHCRRPAAVYL